MSHKWVKPPNNHLYPDFICEICELTKCECKDKTEYYMPAPPGQRTRTGFLSCEQVKMMKLLL